VSTLGIKLKNLFKNGISTDFYDKTEDLLIEADLGPKLAWHLREMLEKKHPKTEEEALTLLKEALSAFIEAAELSVNPGKTNLFLFLGVNGVGKTTSLAKTARYFTDHGHITKITAAAADTFRAAAGDQLEIHSNNQGFRLVKGSRGGDPGAVIHDAVSSALARGDELILADTAGRMHNKAQLVGELKKIDKIITARIEPENYKKILVIDATTGQNGLRQAEVFNEALTVSGIILTKYDGTAKGGAAVAIGRELKIPFYFIGRGEKIADFTPFNKEAFLNDLLS
jgi:fused signal recognition particle receptor